MLLISDFGRQLHLPELSFSAIENTSIKTRPSSFVSNGSTDTFGDQTLKLPTTMEAPGAPLVTSKFATPSLPFFTE
ncbi:hypothetical protein D3C81_1261920 [compost metagenome]